MTTPRPTPFSTTTPRVGVFTPFVIISDSDDEITTLPMRPAPPSPDHTPALYVYPLDSELPSSSRKRSRPLSPSLPPSVPPPPEHIKSLGDNIESSIWNLERHTGP
ncbi:hypothetical protein Tco_0040818 [Tanacetum coccineum]